MRHFSAENNLEPKALLLIDNCTAHQPFELLRSDDGNICVMNLPPNVTALIQPMDQNPIKSVKLKYRNKLLCDILANETVSIHDLLKQHTLSDAIFLLDQAWKELPESILQKSWARLLNWDDYQYEEEDDLPLSELFPSYDMYEAIVNETQQLLSSLAPTCILNAEEVNEWNDYVAEDTDTDDEMGSENDSESMSDNGKIQSVTYNEAITSVNQLIKWCEKNDQGAKHMSNLVNLRTDIVTKHLAVPQIQKHVTDYFISTSKT